MKNRLLLAFLSVSILTLAQSDLLKNTDWYLMLQEERPNVFELKEAYEEYYKIHDFVKNKYTQEYKRFMKENWLNADANGDLPPRNTAPIDYSEFIAKSQLVRSQKASNSQWQEAGPWQYDHEQAMVFEVQSPGSAHVQTVEQSASNPNTVWAGTATAGAWKSIDKGLSWELMTRDLPVNEVYSIAIDPDNSDQVLISGNNTIYKTTNGGIDWTQLNINTGRVRDLQFLNNDENLVLVASQNGLFRSADFGNSFVNLSGLEHMEIEIHPSNPNILYAVALNGIGTEFYKSTDLGLTWGIRTNGWPNPGVGDENKRCEIAVSVDAPDQIFIWAAGTGNGHDGFYGFYISTDAGESFSFQCCGTGPGGPYDLSNQNMLTWSENGDEDGGQYYYDLALGVSPNDADRIFGAGINTWRTENGGTDWTLNSHWVTWVGNLKHRYNHADVHDIKFFKHTGGTDMWVASDGGLYYSSDEGDNLEPRMYGIHGTDFWGFGAGFKDGYKMVGGTYHNGTLVRSNDIYKYGKDSENYGGWLGELGGDNFRGFVNYANNSIAYADNGSFVFSDDRSVRQQSNAFNNDFRCNTSYWTGEYGTYGFDPTNYNRFYSPVDAELYVTEDGGVSWELVKDFQFGKTIQVVVPYSDRNYIYVTHYQSSGNNLIWKSVDQGQTWLNVTPSSTMFSAASGYKYIEVDDENPDKIWTILINGTTNEKVLESNDGGVTWANISGVNLNGEQVVSIKHHYGTNDGLYVGTRRGVYYKNAGMTDWALFNNNLPLTTSAFFLEPYYGEGKIRLASQRGVYECDFYESAGPIAMASANKTSLNLLSDCTPDTVFFADHSTVLHASASFDWYFEGGTPQNSNVENPMVVYSTPGSYDVRLIVEDENGIDTVLLQDFIVVTSNHGAQFPIIEDFNGEFPPEGWKLEGTGSDAWFQDAPQNNTADQCAAFDNYWDDRTGEDYYLVLPSVDLTDGSYVDFSFDYTYNRNGSYIDSLAVVYRTSSNPNWERLWVRGGADLNCAGTDVWWWDSGNPTIEWVNVQLDLSSLVGESCVELAFHNIAQYGNYIWVDDVNLNSNASVIENNLDFELKIFPNPASEFVNVLSTEHLQKVQLYDMKGRLVDQMEMNSKMTHIDVSSLDKGLYHMVIYTDNGIQNQKLVVQ